MFNDPLTSKQCSKLIGELGETVFPFQCAHGRSVPLVPLCPFLLFFCLFPSSSPSSQTDSDFHSLVFRRPSLVPLVNLSDIARSQKSSKREKLVWEGVGLDG